MKIQQQKHKQTETRKTKTQKGENLVLPKEQVENADFHKPVLNKIMNTRQKFIKYNFVAPLKIVLINIVAILMISAKIATLGLHKIKVF